MLWPPSHAPRPSPALARHPRNITGDHRSHSQTARRWRLFSGAKRRELRRTRCSAKQRRDVWPRRSLPNQDSLTRIAQLSALAVIGAVVVALLLTRDSAAPLSYQSSPARIEKLLLGQS